MVVKSATKKRLMDLGIAEGHAHQLADDRKWGLNQQRIEGLLKQPVNQMTQQDILHTLYGRTEADAGEWWTINDIYARIQGVDEIEIPLDLGICNHVGILTEIQEVERKKKKYRIEFPSAATEA